MELKCKINEEIYDNVIVAGESFSDEFNETLDSGTISISHVSCMNDLKPYNDVYIWDAKHVFQGYDKEYIYFDGMIYYIKDYFDETFGENFSYDNIQEIKRNKIKSYTGGQLNSYVNLENDTWADIENTDELVVGQLAFIKVKLIGDDKVFYFKVKILDIKDNKVITKNYGYWERNPVFYKHLLVDTFSESMINVQDLVNGNGILGYEPVYDYTIQLMSETKGLEVTPMPNSSITEPLDFKNKVSVWEYLNRYVDMYSPVYKVKEDTDLFDKAWVFKRKYSISDSLKETFEDVYSPDFSLNNTNLKEMLSKLMITKDLIPYVVNGVIYGMDITKRHGEFDLNLGHINYISGNMSSSDFCDNLKKNYTEALSQDNTARMVEYLGFRNSDNALMTLENMRLETRFPIYKINKVYMCYYKNVHYESDDMHDAGSKYFLCKQDITDLVRLNTERNVLSQDWDLLNKERPKNVKEMKKFKMCTVGYDIGSKYITGWGEKYTYPYQTPHSSESGEIYKKFWDVTKTYLQNIFEKLDESNRLGIYDAGYIRDKLNLNNSQGITVSYGWGAMYSPYNYNPSGDKSVSEEFALALKQKSFIFQVDYEAFYNGTVFHSKDSGLDDITINDNQSSSLTLLEQDGLYTKEKANRLGNKGLVINARYDDINQLQPLGSVYKDKNNEDVIIYHREYQIWDNMVIATYYGMHDYVLKNYFTSVYARHRTWNLMPYNESVRRAENRKIYLYLSKDSCYYEDFRSNDLELDEETDLKNNVFQMKNFVDTLGNKTSILANLLSAFIPSESPISKNYIPKSKRINCGYIVYNNKHFMSDINIFVNGYSLCMNINMPDNISSGNYITKMNPMFNDDYNLATYSGDNAVTSWLSNLFNIFGTFFTKDRDVTDDYTGSLQDWYRMADETTGFSNALGIYFCHLDEDKFLGINDIEISTDKIEAIYENKLIKLPLVEDSTIITNNYSNVIGKTFKIYKDNKELIDMTYQIEPITNDKNIMFSQWLMKLSDLISNHNKFEENVVIKESNAKTEKFFVKYDRDSATIYFNDDFFNKTLDYFSNKDIDYVEVKGNREFVNDIPIVMEPGTLSYRANSIDDGVATTHDIYFERFSIDKNDDGDSIDSIMMQVRQKYLIARKSLEGQHPIYTYDEEKSEKVLDFVYEGKETIDGVEYRKFLSPIVHASSGNNEYLNGYGTTDVDTYFNVLTSVSTKYDKNMFICYSNQELKKTIVYDEYGYAPDYDEIYSFYSVGDFVKYNDLLYQCKFEISKGEPFNSSNWNEISNAQFSGNIYKITKDMAYWKKNDLKVLNNDTNFENIFVFEKEDNNVPYLKIDLNAIKSSTDDDFKSVQYWYFENGSMHFVFGANVNDKEKDDGYLKVYCSILSTRDFRVYTKSHRLLGNSLNYVGSDMTYGLHQLTEGNKIVNVCLLTVEINRYEDVFPLEITVERNEENVIVEDGEILNKNEILSVKLENKVEDHVRVTYTINDVDYTNKSATVVVEEDINISLKEVDVDSYSLSFAEDEHARIIVRRTSSPYKKETLGILNKDSKIYYGDELEISVKHDIGYESLEFNVNEENWTSGNKLIVEGDVSITISSQKADNRTWNEITSGNFVLNTDTDPGTFTYVIDGITLKYTDAATRISGYIIMSTAGVEHQYNLQNIEIPATYTHGYSSCRLFTLNSQIKCTISNAGGIINGNTQTVVITKVEQFYEE